MSNSRTPLDGGVLDRFLDKLEAELKLRYAECPHTTTPDTILLAVLNAIAEARK